MLRSLCELVICLKIDVPKEFLICGKTERKFFSSAEKKQIGRWVGNSSKVVNERLFFKLLAADSCVSFLIN